MPVPYLSLLESLRSSCNLPAFPDPLPSTQFHLKLESGVIVTIDFHPETNLVELFAQLGTYDAKDELDVLRKIAQANFLWAATAGGTLSARLDINTVYLAYQTPISSFNENQENEFFHLVEKFSMIAGQWQAILK
ncbi:MAG: hypothetical protein A3F67_04300 [Verrucomicrobia bacterium RIFCSPHIGHO2_12_FULL_41_10]|nr:MAG: hypothetical protein A3F67_04300 [Verrucomicrobia bacterium RIFCSPHIGHO2_12_FULL_41_10]HLB34540.1 type III secretion system chaperone [Chthoniobacterales bacterium]